VGGGGRRGEGQHQFTAEVIVALEVHHDR